MSLACKQGVGAALSTTPSPTLFATVDMEIVFMHVQSSLVMFAFYLLSLSC